MSQFFVGVTTGSLPPSVPTSFVTDINSPSVPLANVENVFGGSVTTNNIKGIQTDGSSGSNTLTVQLTNRITASAITTDGVTPVQLYSFALGGTPGTYLFTQRIVAFAVDTVGGLNPIGAVYSGFRGIRTTGASAVLINANQVIVGEEGSFTVAEVVNSVSVNNAVLTVTGIAGKTIHWAVLTDYIFTA